jgi:TusA-related sulfurtransferase
MTAANLPQTLPDDLPAGLPGLPAGAPEFQHQIDTRGLSCPLPILRAKKALGQMRSGEVLKVVATDPGSTRDFRAFARQTGNELVAQLAVTGAEQRSEFVHYLRRR